MRSLLLLALVAGCGSGKGAGTKGPPKAVGFCNDPDVCLKECRELPGPSCVRLGLLVTELKAAQPEDTYAALSEACAKAVPHTCGLSGAVTCERPAGCGNLGMEVLTDECEKGDFYACLYLSDTMGEEGNSFKESALPPMEKACAAGESLVCSRLAYEIDDPERSKQLYQQALAAHEKDCAAGDAFACQLAGVTYQSGRGVEEDLVKADGFFAEACKLGKPFCKKK